MTSNPAVIVKTGLDAFASPWDPGYCKSDAMSLQAWVQPPRCTSLRVPNSAVAELGSCKSHGATPPSGLSGFLRKCRARRATGALAAERGALPQEVSLVQMKTVYLLRHGEALHNLVDKGAGSYERRRDPSLADPPLTDKGTSQALAARDLLEKDAWLKLRFRQFVPACAVQSLCNTLEPQWRLPFWAQALRSEHIRLLKKRLRFPLSSLRLHQNGCERFVSVCFGCLHPGLADDRRGGGVL